MWEPVLHHQIGTSDTMREQLARLVALSGLPTVTIHVLPPSLGANRGLGPVITLGTAPADYAAVEPWITGDMKTAHQR